MENILNFDILKNIISEIEIEIANVKNNVSFTMDLEPEISFDKNFEFKFIKGKIQGRPRIKSSLVPRWTKKHSTIVYNILADKIPDDDASLIRKYPALFNEIILSILNNDISEKTRLIEIFNRTLNNETLYCGSNFFIYGVGLAFEKIELMAGKILITLKRPNKDYFVHYYRKNFRRDLIDHDFIGLVADVKMPIEQNKSPDLRYVQKEGEILQWILSLTGLGTTIAEKTEFWSEDFSTLHRAEISKKNFNVRFFYLLDEVKIKFLKENYSLVRQAILDAGFVDGKLNACQVAYERYRDGLTYDTFQKQASSAVMGLEALYTQKGPELLYSLKMRVAIALKIIGRPHSLDVIGLAYKIRSDYAHGNIDSDKLLLKVRSLYKDHNQFNGHILNILRLSIILVLISNLDKKKGDVKEFQKTLDQIMLADEYSLKKIISLIKPFYHFLNSN